MNYFKIPDSKYKNRRQLVYFSPERIAKEYNKSQLMQLDIIYNEFIKNTNSHQQVIGLFMPNVPIPALNLLSRINYSLMNYDQMSDDEDIPDWNTTNFSQSNYEFKDMNFESFLVLGPLESRNFIKRTGSGLFIVDSIAIWGGYKINNKSFCDKIANIIASKSYKQNNNSNQSEENILENIVKIYEPTYDPDVMMYEEYMSSDFSSRMRIIDSRNGEYLLFVNMIFNEYTFYYFIPQEKFLPITVNRISRSRQIPVSKQNIAKHKKVIRKRGTGN